MAAEDAVLRLLSPGDHVIIPDDAYGGTFRLLARVLGPAGLEWSAVDLTDRAALEAAWRDETRLVWVETPTNPRLTIVDIAGTAALAHERGARVAVDNTFATPYLQLPITRGADLVVHSSTKYLGGHSDVVAGALATARADALWERVRRNRTTLGQILGPLEAFLLVRGMRTLPLRVEAASVSAMELARRFARHGAVAEVLYPGLPGHPGHDIARRQMEGGFGGMLSIRVRGGESAAVATAAGVELWKRATSLGGVESLIEHRASIEGAGSPCPPDLLRLSTGIEDVDDLYVDLDRALGAAHG
jgi:cystathionine gamma-synthase